MSEPVLAALKICLLVLLYLFFLRVVRAVWMELRVAGPAEGTVTAAPPRRSTRRRGEGPVTRLVLVEPAGATPVEVPLEGEITIGRAPGCVLTLDDSFLSQLHARVTRRGEEIWVEDLGSTNGTYLNGHRVVAPALMTAGDRLALGNNVLELQ